MCKQNNFQIVLLFAIEMAVLSVFLQKKGLGPLGVKCKYLAICVVKISYYLLCKILQLDVQKKKISDFFTHCCRNGSF